MGIKEKKTSHKPRHNESLKKESTIDHRFNTLQPQFRKPKSKDSKIELDDRFKTVLTDPKFQLQTLDKYGRKSPKIEISKNKSNKITTTNGESNQKGDFDEFYTVKSEKDDRFTIKDDDNANDEIPEPLIVVSKNSRKTRKATKNSENDLDDDDNGDRRENDIHGTADPISRIAYLNALSRGEIQMSSSDDDDDDDDDDDSDDIEDNELDDEDDNDDYNAAQLAMMNENTAAGILDPSYVEEITAVVIYTTNASPYLAVMNADWAHFRAVDIFAIMSSFVPGGSAVRRVCVYPSNFGLERLKKEELFGPVDVWKSGDGNLNHDDDDGSDEGDDDEPNPALNNTNINDDDGDDEIEMKSGMNHDIMDGTEDINTDFDPEKLRLYEASRLKYFFAVVEFSNPQYTDIAYKEVDGMEFEHSSAALDLRIIPVDEINDVIANRMVRDEATSVPSNYNPPDFVVNALQQSTVQCTWDVGDRNREVLLTKYNVSGQSWNQVSEADDLKAYVASEQSSEDEGSVRVDKKSNRLRSMLGLDSDDENANDDDDIGGNIDSEESNDSDSHDDDEKYEMQATYIPGKSNNKKTLQQSNDDEKQDRELTPWEKYQEKRQQKKREKRAAVREKRKQANEDRKKGTCKVNDKKNEDDFFVEQNNTGLPIDTSSQFVNTYIQEDYNGEVDGQDDDRDFDIRGVQRLEKNKDKKLTGARKRKEEKLTGNVRTDFEINTADERFKAVLEGNDERFGIDRTDPNFKETPAMKQILSEQTRHRAKQRKLNSEKQQITNKVPDVNAHAMKPTSGSAALSALVSSIKSKVMR